MQQKRVLLLAFGLGILILGMLYIQVHLLFRSAEIQEKQFQQKVNLALCSAVEKLAKDQDVCNALSSCTIGPENGSIRLLGNRDKQKVEDVLKDELEEYGIEIPFTVGLGDPKNKNQFQASSNVFPDLGLVNVFLEFPTKEDFIRSELKGMYLVSFFLAILFMAVFFLAFRSLLHQQKAYSSTVDHIDALSHQLKTPINNINLGLDLLTKELEKSSGSKVKEYLEMIQTESSKLRERVNKSLGTGTLEPLNAGMDKKINIQDLLKKVKENFKVRIEESEATVHLELEAEIYIQGNPASLEMAFNALLDNALKFSGQKARVSIACRAEDLKAVIKIADEGPGIPDEELERVMEKYYRGMNGEKNEGHGIGLYSSKRIIENHGGIFKLASQEGKGTQVTVEMKRI